VIGLLENASVGASRARNSVGGIAAPSFLKSRGVALFIAIVAFPTLVAAVYFGLLASDIYISESRFVVRAPGKPSTPSLGMILSSGGLASASDDSYAVVDYVRSRNALFDSNKDGMVRRIYSEPGISLVDRFDSPFRGRTNEHLYRYFGNKVDIAFDSSSQVTTLQVSAYSPQDARALNERLLEHSEQLVNRLSERGRTDAIQSAQVQVEDARSKARNAIVALGQFRNSSGIIDPEKQASINLQMISKVQDALLAERAQLAQLEAYTPRNPQIPASRIRIRVLEREIARQSGNVAGAPKSLSAAATRYQQLQFDADFAGKQLAVALAALQEAENDARRKQIYVERIAEPNLPDYPLEPRRLRGILATLVLSLLAWGVLVTLTAGIREHRD
jgi:BexC/CtrB/KpsE family polysaccharide export inner-membrane protein